MLFRSTKPKSIQKITTNTNKTSNSNPNSNFKESQLWATKYAPESLEEIVGNKETINKLTTWLKDWDDVVLSGNKKDVVWKGKILI